MKTKATKELEHKLWQFTHQKLGTYGCFEVTMGLGMMRDHTEIVDYVTYDKDGVVRCYELKTSYEDFKSNARVSFWGNFNYLVTTPEVWRKVKEKHEFEWSNGVYVPSNDSRILKSVHKGSRHTITVGERVSIIESMVRSMDREEQKLYQIRNY